MEAVNRSKYELYELFKVLEIKDADWLVEAALNHFRTQFEMRPEQYPGDGELYNLVKRCILKGLKLEEAITVTLTTIKREIIMLDASRSIGLSYNLKFYP